MKNLQLRFGHLVAAHRKRLDWTQRKLAEASELSDDMIARIEAGATGASFKTIEKLANALNVDPAELFGAGSGSSLFATGELSDLTARLAKLNPGELLWLRRIIDAALASRP